MLHKLALIGGIVAAGVVFMPQMGSAAGVTFAWVTDHTSIPGRACAIPALTWLVSRMSGALGRRLALPALPGSAWPLRCAPKACAWRWRPRRLSSQGANSAFDAPWRRCPSRIAFALDEIEPFARLDAFRRRSNTDRWQSGDSAHDIERADVGGKVVDKG